MSYYEKKVQMTFYGKVPYKSKCGKTNYQKMGFLIKYSTKTISKYCKYHNYHISIHNGTKNRGVRIDLLILVLHSPVLLEPNIKTFARKMNRKW